MVGFLVSCNTGTNPKTEVTLDEIQEISFLELETSIPFSGIYVNEDYLKTLLETKSPHIAQEKCIECMITIPNKTLERTIMIYSFHEGGGYLTVVKNDDQFQIWGLVNNKPEFHSTDINTLSENSIQIFNKNFIKIQEIDGFTTRTQSPLIAEKYLFNGVYIDELGNKIEFDEIGNVKGFNSYSIYYPRFDYYDVGLDIDQVGFSSKPHEYDWYGFKFFGDTLSLYEITCIDFNDELNNCERVDYGELKYKFWKE
jgi:hypothetical protein